MANRRRYRWWAAGHQPSGLISRQRAFLEAAGLSRGRALARGANIAVKPHHVHPFRRNRGDQAAKEIQRVEDDFGLPCVEGLAEFEPHLASIG